MPCLRDDKNSHCTPRLLLRRYRNSFFLRPVARLSQILPRTSSLPACTALPLCTGLHLPVRSHQGQYRALFLHSYNASTPHALRTQLRPCCVPFVRMLRSSRVPKSVRYCATTAPLVHLHLYGHTTSHPWRGYCSLVALQWQSCVKSMSHPLQTYCTEIASRLRSDCTPLQKHHYCTSIASSFLHPVAPCCTVFTCFAAVAPHDRRIVGPRADESTAAVI